MRRASLAVVLLLAIVVTGCTIDVLHGLPEAEANRVLATLQAHGIGASKRIDNAENGTFAITVAQGASARAWAILDEYKLPKEQKRGFKDVFGESSLVVTPMQEQARYLEALQGELAHTLESIEGVIDARVHLVMPERDLTGQIVGRPKASVVLEYQAGQGGLLPVQNAEVQALVSHSVDGLTPDAVAVVQKPAAISAPTSARAGQFNLVSIGPLVMEQSSLGVFKGVLATVVLTIGVLGFLLFWQGRTVSALRDELLEARQRAQSLQRSGGRTA
jgi:type III secretion protein J